MLRLWSVPEALHEGSTHVALTLFARDVTHPYEGHRLRDVNEVCMNIKVNRKVNYHFRYFLMCFNCMILEEFSCGSVALQPVFKVRCRCFMWKSRVRALGLKSKVMAAHYKPHVGKRISLCFNLNKMVGKLRHVLPGGGCDVGRGGIGLSSLGIFKPSCSVN